MNGKLTQTEERSGEKIVSKVKRRRFIEFRTLTSTRKFPFGRRVGAVWIAYGSVCEKHFVCVYA